MQGYAQSFDPASASQTLQLTMRGGGTALVLSESMYRGLQTAPHVVLKVARTTTDIVQALSMDRYFSLFHVSVDEVAGSSEVDVALHAHGRGCKVRLYTDNYQAASEIASQTDLVVTLPRQLARRHAQDITQLPFDWRP